MIWPLKYEHQHPGFEHLDRVHPRCWEVLRPGEIDHRDELGSLLTAKGLHGTGVEVGVQRGEYSAALLANWSGNLTLVDPWCEIEGYDNDPASVSQEEAEENLSATIKRLEAYKHRIKIVRSFSADAVKIFSDESLAFVYLDARHTRPFIDNDLEEWHQKIYSGGLLCGHDIVCPGGGWTNEVLPAVVEFALKYGYDVFLIPFPNGWMSYYMIVEED